MVTKTQEEWDTMMQAEQKAHLIDEEMTVFGRNRVNEPAFKKAKGQPVEMGFGSPGRETPNHFAAIRKYEGEDAYREAYEDFAKRSPEHFKKLSLPKPIPKLQKTG